MADPGGIIRFRFTTTTELPNWHNGTPQRNNIATSPRSIKPKLGRSVYSCIAEHAQYLAVFSNKRTQQPADRAFVRLH